ncbi:carbohydrate sulfotransferase 11-like [Periplaneta americana]|uniref:carbohydrate sulfotransferase 11-like n=1 Tax=Periplaneta americana TaxID=6978 RepID=UPI0037E771FA
MKGGAAYMWRPGFSSWQKENLRPILRNEKPGLHMYAAPPFIWTSGPAADAYQREKITKICSQATDDLTLPRSRHFLVNHEHKLLYCWIHKVASTSWIAFFSHLANRTHIEEYYREINILSPKNQEELEEVTRNKDYYKLMIVRHPFQRLVSAYRDRIEDTSRFTSQAWIYVPRIFSLTRPSLNISHIFNTSHHQPTLSIVPSFEEFVQWLIMITPTKYDVHWNRYTDHCNPCAVHYNTVIKMDNFTYEEEISVLQEMGVQHLNVTLQHFQLTSGGPTDFNVSCHYFQQLLREQVEALYSIYRKDFEMFQYSVEPYINCARNHRSSDNTTVSNATTEDTK